jgi:uncharacterized protein (DUF342 family)
MTVGTEENPKSIDIAGEDGSYVLHLFPSVDGLECRGTVVVKQASLALSPERFLAIFKKLGITHGLVKQQCLELCYAVRQGKSRSNLLLARGVLPFDGKNGFFEFVPGVYREHPNFSENEDGSVDFRRLNTFGNVQPGQLIGTLQPPTVGNDGVSVYGKPIPAAAGEPLNFTVDEGARGPDGQGRVYAERAGRVIFDGQTLTVSEEYLVDGDVDLEVGHIDFVGFVEIHGDVPDGFDIRAGKGLKVSGIVGACRIYADGDVELRGMAGLGTGKIVCRGNLIACFLNDVEVECGGDLIVQNEIRNSFIKCAGVVSLPKGMISGGECIALGGIEANKIGAPSGLHTELDAGIDFRVREQLREARAMLHDVTAEIREFNNILASFNERHQGAASLSPAEKARMVELMDKLGEREVMQRELADRIDNLQGSASEGANGKVNVKSVLREGVVIAIGKAREGVKSERSGPLSIIENSLDHCLRYLPMSPLSKSSRLIEKELLEKEREKEKEKSAKS